MKRQSKVLKHQSQKRIANIRQRLSIAVAGVMGTVIFSLISFSACGTHVHFSPEVSAEKQQNEIEKALFVRREFFGAEAIVPLPTRDARRNLGLLAEIKPDNLQILEKLAEFDEKLSNFGEAEKWLIRSVEIEPAKNEKLFAFYERRAEFAKAAEILNKIFLNSAPQFRTETLRRLIVFARKHELSEYLKTDFYDSVARTNPEVYEIYEQIADDLTREKNYAEALKFVRQAKLLFPERRGALLEKEVDILLDTNKPEEAESVYQAAFDPLWTETEAEKFYDFLSRQDRLRAYGAEVKARFKNNPADFDAGIRLALYQNHDYSYGNDELAPIILRIERAKKDWTTEELITGTRLLLRAGEAETASRFLYTLYLREDFKKSGDLRGKILYQLFEMFSDAEKQKLPLTRGDLSFYENVAKTDTNPGITTGILSLIFSDTNPRRKLAEEETKANIYFNRAAAYRIFLAYKEEFSTSPELAQMYLDIVRLYAATNEPETAKNALDEFESRYENSSDYPRVALKLADAFSALNQPDKTREIYRKVLDYLGKRGNPLAPRREINRQNSNVSNYESGKALENPNDGINIPDRTGKPKTGYYEAGRSGGFHDYLGRKSVTVTYAEVLERLVASLAKEKRTSDILALYSGEIQKYPAEEWLYEQRLAWLEQTNLTEEQLKVYQTALARFQSRSWQDKLARWFLRENRQADFAAFSQELVWKLGDAEIQNYLSQFVDGKVAASDFEKELYFKLYTAARKRFPHNSSFVTGLLHFYKTNKREAEWRALAAEHYFEFPEVREQFLDDLAEKGELREYLARATGQNEIYDLFRADASVRLSIYENAIDAYRKLNEAYPNTAEFSERLIDLTRSFGQKNREILNESATLANAQANFTPSNAEQRTRSGEIYAELGEYKTARAEWRKLIAAARGEKETYLDAATVNWDYFQYDEALLTIKTLREKYADKTLYAFESGAIFEALHKLPEAVSEYVKALDSDRSDENQKEKAKNRLAVLVNREKREKREQKARNEKDRWNGITNTKQERNPDEKGETFIEISAPTTAEKTIDAAFIKESAHRPDASYMTLGYAEFLAQINKGEKADGVLSRAVQKSKDQKFIEAAREFYQSEENASGEQLALKRLAEIVSSPRQKIAFRLQLAESFEENQNRSSAKTVIKELVRQFPNNYGVLLAASDFYNRLGFENEAASVLENALPRSRGRFRQTLARKLGVQMIKLNRPDSAARILGKLHEEDPSDTEIFGELVKIYVRSSDAASLRRAFLETVKALKTSDADRRELDAQIADLRSRMIDAFTRLKDYRSAIEQHIEIINRDPEDESLTENAIRYVQRYGGAETLLDYYRKTSLESFKNYRWNVVLARIFEAQTDWENAAKNYESAIGNQPEMPELYAALAEVQTKSGAYEAALKSLDECLKLTNDAPDYIMKKIEILKKAGRFSDAEKEQAKLPVEKGTQQAANEFAEAKKALNSEREKARKLYREGFKKLLEDPSIGDLNTADLSGYVESLREEEPLDQINENLWKLREKLAGKAGEINSPSAGEARKRLSIVDRAIIEAVGRITKTVGTDEERGALHENLSRRIDEISDNGTSSADNHQTLLLIRDLSRRGGFGDLEERILRQKTERSNSSIDKQTNLQNLIIFYNERGAYQKAFNALEDFGSGDLSLKAEMARLAGNGEKELEALRTIYWENDKVAAPKLPDVARYLEILHSENRAELKSLTEKASAYQLQLINFLLGKGERELAHAAIENSNFSAAWKAARHAETSLALKEFGDDAECYFCDALQFDTIGNLINQTPDKKSFLINDDWFRLTREYGEWLEENPVKSAQPQKFLTAMIENQPRNAKEHFKLGEFYLDRRDAKAAIEHFRIALELEPNDKKAWANIGAAYYLANRKDWAEDCWRKAIEGNELKTLTSFFETLRKYNLAENAREKLATEIITFLENNDAGNSPDFQNLTRAVASSFASDAEKSDYFLKILNNRPTDISLAAMLLDESLIGKSQQDKFYELLIRRQGKLASYDRDYDFAAIAQRVLTTADAESVFDQENDYQIEIPENNRVKWQMKYLLLLIEQQENERAAKLIAEIDKELKNRYATPTELRLAKIRLGIRQGDFDETAAETFTGIAVSDSAAEIKAPSVERFNDVLKMLREENRTREIKQISGAFYARMVALEQFNAANLAGFSRALFERGETNKALRFLQLTVDLTDEATRESSAGEIAAIDEVKAKAADAVKLTEDKAGISFNQPDALKTAAEIAAEFGQIDAAIAFRHRLAETTAADTNNLIELARLLNAKGEKGKAVSVLNQTVNNRNALRSARWRARGILSEMGEAVEFGSVKYDAFSQFYTGIAAENNNQETEAAEIFLNSLIAENDAEVPARQKLIELYVLTDKPFAALKLGETDKSAKPDGLLSLLSESAEKVGNYMQSSEYERAKAVPSEERIILLRRLNDEKNRKVTDFTVNQENTRKL